MALTPPDKLLRFVSPKPDFMGDDGNPTWHALEPSSAGTSSLRRDATSSEWVSNRRARELEPLSARNRGRARPP